MKATTFLEVVVGKPSSLLSCCSSLTMSQGRRPKHPLRELLHSRCNNWSSYHARQRRQWLLCRHLVNGGVEHRIRQLHRLHPGWEGQPNSFCLLLKGSPMFQHCVPEYQPCGCCEWDGDDCSGNLFVYRLWRSNWLDRKWMLRSPITMAGDGLTSGE